VSAFRGKTSPLKAALLDQRIIAGLGNIYVCEALFRARLSPRRKASTVGPERAERLVRAVREVLQDAVDAGGSTLRDYARADGELGYFQHSFSVYGRDSEPCRRIGCAGVVRRIVQSNRSTFYCSTCQR
jgi:formamidopyrimidine-DNA glycosylase